MISLNSLICGLVKTSSKIFFRWQVDRTLHQSQRSHKRPLGNRRVRLGIFKDLSEAFFPFCIIWFFHWWIKKHTISFVIFSRFQYSFFFVHVFQYYNLILKTQFWFCVQSFHVNYWAVEKIGDTYTEKRNMKILLFRKNDNINVLWGRETSIIQNFYEFCPNLLDMIKKKLVHKSHNQEIMKTCLQKSYTKSCTKNSKTAGCPQNKQTKDHVSSNIFLKIFLKMKEWFFYRVYCIFFNKREEKNIKIQKLSIKKKLHTTFLKQTLYKIVEMKVNFMLIEGDLISMFQQKETAV